LYQLVTGMELFEGREIVGVCKVAEAHTLFRQTVVQRERKTIDLQEAWTGRVPSSTAVGGFPGRDPLIRF
jgi:hypothetical protein